MENKRNYSPKRQAILRAISSTKEHPTVEWVCNEVKKSFPNISLATVYRNIAQLKEDGLIISVGVIDGHERLDAFTASHPHFVCRKCNSVIDVEVDAENEAMCKSVEKRYGTITEHYDITFWGYCANCKK